MIPDIMMLKGCHCIMYLSCCGKQTSLSSAIGISMSDDVRMLFFNTCYYSNFQNSLSTNVNLDRLYAIHWWFHVTALVAVQMYIRLSCQIFELVIQAQWASNSESISILSCCHAFSQRKCHHFEIFITACTGSCHFDNFQCSQWKKIHQNDDIFTSVFPQNSNMHDFSTLHIKPALAISSPTLASDVVAYYIARFMHLIPIMCQADKISMVMPWERGRKQK